MALIKFIMFLVIIIIDIVLFFSFDQNMMIPKTMDRRMNGR